MFKLKKCIELIISFSKIGTLVVGGGYSMVPVMRHEVVNYRKWIDDNSMVECMALGQSLPGVITINTSVFIGYRVYGIWGALSAVFGIVFPAFLIITLFASVFEKYQNMEIVQNIMSGIRASVFALILASVLKLFKSSVKDVFQILLFICILLFMLFYNLSPIIAIIISGVIGYIIFIKRREKY